jgi:ketosteroid isomerase-like protein
MSKPGGEVTQREGYVMSIYTRQSDGRWLLARDANLLGPAVS